MEIFIWIIGLLFVAGLYFIPARIAFKKNKKNKVAILAFNLLLGWSFIGWVLALIWSLTKD